MKRSVGGLIMVLTWINSLFIQQQLPLNVSPIAIKVNECCKTTCGSGVSGGGGGSGRADGGGGVCVVVVGGGGDGGDGYY